MGEMLYTQEALDEVTDEARVLRDELSHIADALGVAPYGGCYEQAEVLERAKALAKRVEELEEKVGFYVAFAPKWVARRNGDLPPAERRAGRAK